MALNIPILNFSTFCIKVPSLEELFSKVFIATLLKRKC